MKTRSIINEKRKVTIPVYKVDTRNDRQLDRISTTTDVFCR